ncbi:phage portal protein [Wukongibacter sp. M2B1]|uniref:phage portal protein n=1 Tax=Wukongibacter sp. M2B1 TaxID=3088895 RepID=UPI003D7A228D
MGFLKSRFKNDTTFSLQDEQFLSFLGIDVNGTINSKLGEITYFTCIKNLSETISKIPLKVIQNTEKGHIQDNKHYLYNRFKKINPYMTASVFWSCVETNRNHYGNAYVYNEIFKSGRNAGKTKALWILPSQEVELWIDNVGLFGQYNALWYKWQDSKSGKKFIFRNDEILHFKTSVSLDGITGLAIKDILSLQVETAKKGQEYLNKFYKSGMFGGKAVLQYTGDLDKKAETKLVEKIESFTNGSISTTSGKIIPLPLGFQMQPLNLSMSEAQFIELNQYSALQVAGAFGIKPSHLNIYTKSSYKDVEMQQRDFYINTSMSIFKQYEEETTRKLLNEKEIFDKGYEIQFEVNAILRGDFKTQVETIGTAIDKGVMKINEGRNYLGLSLVEEGDVLLANGTYIPVKMIQQGINYNQKGGDNENE